MKSYIVGNWKMNFSVGEASIYLHKLLQKLGLFVMLRWSSLPHFRHYNLYHFKSTVKIRLAAQCANPHDFGAYTGAVSFTQLRGLVDYCLVGHSERRQLFHESDKDIRAGIAAALRNNITPILCIGETETEHTFGETYDVLRDQLLGGLSEISPKM